MANRWCDGLGRYLGTTARMLNGSSGQAWAQVDSSFALSNVNPRTGTWHLRLDTSTGGIAAEARRVFGAALTEVFIGFAIYCNDLPASETSTGVTAGHYLCSLRDASNGHQVEIWLGTDGSLYATTGTTTGEDTYTVLGRSDPVIGAGAYQHIEIYAKAGIGTGALEVRVDEVTKLNLTSITTVHTANVEFSQFAFGFNIAADDTVIIDFADFFCNSVVDDGSACSTWLGDCKSGWLPVNADTAQADFAKSTGTVGFSLLNDGLDTTYINTASTAAESDFGLTDGPANLSEVLTVRPAIRAKKDDAGTCSIAPNVKSGSTKGTVSAQPVTTAFAYYDSNVPIDPATGVPYTASGLNALKHVVERTA